MDEKIKVFFLVLGFFILSIVILLVIFHKFYTLERETYLQTMTQSFEALYKNNAYLLKERANIVFDIFINKEDVLKIMAEASKIKDKNSKEFKKLHEKLYKNLYKVSDYMKKYKLQDLNFNLPDYTNLIRFYRPEKYGDSLKGFRKSLEIVQELKSPVSCFEIGRAVHAFRNVFPLYYKGIFVGTVDIAYHANSIISGIEMALPVYIEFLIDCNSIQKNLYKEEQKNYIRSSIFDGYFIDKEVEIFNESAEKIKREVQNINKRDLENIKINLKKGKSFSTNLKIKDKSYLITFINIRNCEGENIAYFVIYKPDKFFEYLYKSFLITTTVSTFLLMLIFLSLYFYLSKQVEHKKKLIIISETDPLTDIANRRAFMEKIEETIKISQKFDYPLSVILFDIDNFKKVNDTYGHDVGDYVLKEITKIVSNQLRKTDFFARWGGEEFMILLENTKLEDAIQLAERLRKSIENYQFEKVGHITISLSVAKLKSDEDIDSFFKRLDELLYKAKRKGKNRVEFEEN
jgi:diguanylate cyclase (GGDEF)-like protein